MVWSNRAREECEFESELDPPEHGDHSHPENQIAQLKRQIASRLKPALAVLKAIPDEFVDQQ
jgi:hypothetical protein